MLLGLDDPVIELAVTPDRGYCFSVRGLARELAGAFDSDFVDPATRVEVPAADGDAWPVTLDDPACARFVARRVDGVDPAAPSPWWMQRRLLAAGHAADLAGRRRHQLRDARAGPAAARLRRRPADRRHRRAPGPAGRDADHARRRRAPARPRRPAHHRRLRADRRSPASWAGASTEIGRGAPRRHDRRRAGGRALRPGRRSPGPLGGTSCPARRRGASSGSSTRSCRRWRPSGPHGCSSSTAAARSRPAARTPAPRPRADAGAHAAGAARPRRRRAYERGATVRRLQQVGVPRGVRHRDRRARRRRRHAAVVAAGPRAGRGPRGGGAAPGGLRHHPVGAAARPARARAHRRPSCAAAPSRGRWPRPAASRCCRSPSSEPRSGTRSACPPTTSAAGPCAVANPLDADRPALATTLLPGLLDALVRNRARGFTDLCCTPSSRSCCRTRTRSPMPDPDVDATGRRTPSTRRSRPRCRPSRCTWAVVLAGDRERRGWWGPGRPARWADAIEIGRLVGTAAGVELRVTTAALPPWHPGRCAALRVGDWVVGSRRRAAPEGRRGTRPPAAHLRRRDRPRRAARCATTARPRGCRPTRRCRWTSRSWRAADVPAAELTEALEDRRRRPAGGGAAVRRLHRRAGGARGSARWRSRLRFRAPDRTLTSEEANAARDAAVAVAADRFGAALR